MNNDINDLRMEMARGDEHAEWLKSSIELRLVVRRPFPQHDWYVSGTGSTVSEALDDLRKEVFDWGEGV